MLVSFQLVKQLTITQYLRGRGGAGGSSLGFGGGGLISLSRREKVDAADDGLGLAYLVEDGNGDRPLDTIMQNFLSTIALCCNFWLNYEA